jgi:electron transfer flavoprotein alpha subunit
MAKLFVLAEHRQGQVRDITFEMLTKGREIAEKTGAELTAVIVGKNVKEQAKNLAEYAKNVLVIEESRLENFNSEGYGRILSTLIAEHKPMLVLMGHTSYGVDLAPRLAAEMNLPLATDCIDLAFENGAVAVTKQMYGGKVNVKANMRDRKSVV